MLLIFTLPTVFHLFSETVVTLQSYQWFSLADPAADFFFWGGGQIAEKESHLE